MPPASPPPANSQIMSVITAMGKYTNVQTEYAIKDNLPKNATTITAQIIVGTPGTMVDKVINVTTSGVHFRQGR